MSPDAKLVSQRSVLKEQMVRTLRKCVETDLSPFLRGRGFEPEQGDRLTYCYRRRGPQNHDLFEVQFSKHQEPKFKINLGVVAAHGLVNWLGRLVPSDEVRVRNLDKQADLCSTSFGKLLFGWFGVSYPSRLLPDLFAKQEIEKVKIKLAQADHWFNTKIAGPNIRVVSRPDFKPGTLRSSLEEEGKWPPQYWTEDDEEAVRHADSLYNSKKK